MRHIFLQTTTRKNYLEVMNSNGIDQLKFRFKDGSESLICGSRKSATAVLQSNYNYLDTAEADSFKSTIAKANMPEAFC